MSPFFQLHSCKMIYSHLHAGRLDVPVCFLLAMQRHEISWPTGCKKYFSPAHTKQAKISRVAWNKQGTESAPRAHTLCILLWTAVQYDQFYRRFVQTRCKVSKIHFFLQDGITLLQSCYFSKGQAVPVSNGQHGLNQECMSLLVHGITGSYWKLNTYHSGHAWCSNHRLGGTLAVRRSFIHYCK